MKLPISFLPCILAISCWTIACSQSDSEPDAGEDAGEDAGHDGSDPADGKEDGETDGGEDASLDGSDPGDGEDGGESDGGEDGGQDGSDPGDGEDGGEDGGQDGSDPPPEDEVQVQLIWNTPADPDHTDQDGTDLDLHLLHQNAQGTWNESPWDCFSGNPNPDWGVPDSPVDDPLLDPNDTDGAGPENIILPGPEADHDYKIGVYYLDDAGYGLSLATVRVSINGQQVGEFPNKNLAAKDTFWHVATIRWTSDGQAQIIPVDEIHTGFP